MGLNEKRTIEITLEKLLNKGLNGELSEEDHITLEEIFIEVYGHLPINMALDPRHALRKIRLEEANEDDAVEKWYEGDNDFDDDTVNVDIEFMCNDLDQCYSYKLYGEACNCVRRNFKTPNQYKEWRNKTLLDMGTKLRDVDPTEY